MLNFCEDIFFLSCQTNDVTNFQKDMKLMFSLACHLRFLIVIPETLEFEWQCSQYLELNPTCVARELYLFGLISLKFPICSNEIILNISSKKISNSSLTQ